MIEPRALTGALLVLLSQSATAQEAPPGLVPVEGGRVKLGTEVKDAEELIQKNSEMANVLVAETPQVQEKLDDFFLMPTEVTNEQYAVFVEIAGIKPPYTWADATAQDAARTAFLEEQGKAAAEARAQGQRIETKKFDPEEWWAASWESNAWAVPQDLAEHPATFVDYDSAVAYATWAGLRLPTEAEWIAAARGESDDVFPWGDDWIKTNANTVDTKYADTKPVGSYADGVRNGIHDLAGNVWEWTASPFTRFEGYKPMSVKVDRGRTIEALAEWEPSFRVLKGGAFPNPLLAARVATRMGGMKSQSTAAIGFRCAASRTPGLDVAAAVLENDVTMSALPAGVSFAPGRAAILQRWTHEPGKVGDRIGGYAVITGHSRIVFVPVEKIEENSTKNVDTKSLVEPVVFGLFSTSIPIASPELNAGTYVVAYRAAGDLPEEKEPQPGEEQQPTTLRFQEAPGFDPTVDQYIFFDGQGNPMGTAPAPDIEYERQNASTVEFEAYVPPKREDPKAPPAPALDTVRFRAMTGSNSSSKGFWFTVDLKTGPGSVDTTWK